MVQLLHPFDKHILVKPPAAVVSVHEPLPLHVQVIVIGPRATLASSFLALSKT